MQQRGQINFLLLLKFEDLSGKQQCSLLCDNETVDVGPTLYEKSGELLLLTEYDNP